MEGSDTETEKTENTKVKVLIEARSQDYNSKYSRDFGNVFNDGWPEWLIKCFMG
jgi:hypothetical protein